MKRRIIGLLLAAVCIVFSGSVGAAAEEELELFVGRSLESVIAEFREQYHLNEYNFSVSYYNTVTGETYHFNETEMMVAASTYKMPLNLYYYKLELAGEIAPDAYIPNAGVTLDIAHQRSIVDSNNEISEGMLYNLGNFRTYKDKMREFFTMTDEEISAEYYTGNFYCSRMMLDALRYLYEHAEDYGEMLDYMKQAQPDGYFHRLVKEYDVAHKYGSYEGAENDVGIIYTAQPFLLAVYTQNAGGEAVCAQLARLLTDYNVYYAELDAQEQQRLAEQEAKEQAEAAARAEAEAKAQAAAAEQAAQAAQPAQSIGGADAATDIFISGGGQYITWWMLALAGGICVLGGLGVFLIFRKPGKYEQKYKKKFEKQFTEEKDSTVR